MSKSLSFCQQTARERSGYADRPLDKATEHDAKKLLDDLFADKENFSSALQELSWDGNVARVKIRDITAEIHYDPDADFDYFTSVSSINDGTLCFYFQDLANCIGKVIGILTYAKWKKPPKAGDHIKYTIGNYIVLDECGGDYVPKDKPWMKTRTTIMLPVKYENS